MSIAPSALFRIVIVALCLWAPVAGRAQSVDRSGASSPASPVPTSLDQTEPLARYIPIEAAVYARLSDDRLRQLFHGDADGPQSELQELLKHRPRIIAMPSWRNRKEVITLCRPERPADFARAIGAVPDAVIGEDGPVRVYRLPGPKFAASDGAVFVFSDIAMDASALFGQSVRLLSDRRRRSLLDDSRFRQYLQDADPQASAVVFVDEPWSRRQGAQDPGERYRPSWLPDLESGCLEVFLDDGQVRCRVRCRRRTGAAPLTQAIAAPQAALVPPGAAAAWMVPVDSISMIEFVSRYLPQSQSSFARQLARVVAETELKGILPLSDLGPRTTWCMLSGVSGGNIDVALLIEARQPELAARTLGQICRGIADLVNTHETAINYEAEYTSAAYKGRTVYQLSIHALDGSAVIWPVLMDTQPSISAIGDQVVLASNVAVLQALIDHATQAADAPAAPLQPWVQAAQQPHDDTQIRGFIDPARLASALQPVQQSLGSRDSGLLTSQWFQSLRDYFQDTPVQLGARLRRDNTATPGRVLVLSVLEGRPADGRLRPGDYIAGIDGSTLALDDPTEDLRLKLQARVAGGKRTLRVERDSRLLDVDVFLPRAPDKSIVGLLDDTTKAIQALEALGRRVEIIDYHQHGNDPQRLDAEVTLRLRSQR